MSLARHPWNPGLSRLSGRGHSPATESQVWPPRSPVRSHQRRAHPASRPGSGARARLASAALALADADVARPHDVGPVPELLRDAAVGHRPLGRLLLAVRLHGLLERLLLGVGRLAHGHLAAALGLLLLLVVVLGVDEGQHIPLVARADRGRQRQALAVLHPAHCLQQVHCPRHLRDRGRDPRVGELDPPELLLAGVADDVARELVDEFQGLLCLRQRQGPQRLLEWRQLVRYLVPRRVAGVTHPGWAAEVIRIV
mmetsp:Transcript_70448/g.198844  ORF Transcript_70448/g.198844 Transcript_70448/m.198844 type:complete len:255 (-) Transcript_70448:45-809(-)